MESSLRREVSREAARKRRRVESHVFADLCRLLPLQPSVRQTLDKPSVIRLTLSYMRAHALFKGSARLLAQLHLRARTGDAGAAGGRWSCGGRTRSSTLLRIKALFLNRDGTGGGQSLMRGPAATQEDASMFLTILEGFLMVLSPEGDVILLSDNVSQFVGLTQVQ